MIDFSSFLIVSVPDVLKYVFYSFTSIIMALFIETYLFSPLELFSSLLNAA